MLYVMFFKCYFDFILPTRCFNDKKKLKKNEKAFFLLPQTNLKYTGLSETTLVIEIKGC